MKSIILAISVLLLVSATHAQSRSKNSSSYKTALGVKVWDGAGVSLKHFFTSNNAGELIGYFWRNGVRFTGLYEIHGNFSDASGLRWYIGPGVHVGFYDDRHYHKDERFYHAGHTTAGLDGVLGLDYKFKGAPINMSIDWQPSFEFADGHGFVGSWGGLGIRYTF